MFFIILNYSFNSFLPLYSSTKYNGLFLVSLNILPKYSPIIPNSIICIPEKNSINNYYKSLRKSGKKRAIQRFLGKLLVKGNIL